MIKEYSWKVGSYFSKSDANKIGQELEFIEKTNDLNAKNVVDYAREHTNSELYNIFDWNDTTAAEKYRRDVASRVISSIRVEIIEDKTKKTNTPIKAYVQVAKRQNFEPIEVFVKDTDKYQILLEKAYRELNGVKDRYTELTEIQELLADIPVYDD